MPKADRSFRAAKRKLEQSQARRAKLDGIIQKLYEDNVEGKISDERFMKMTESYESEQCTLESRIAELQWMISTEQEATVNADSFLKLVRKYTDITELTPDLIREFVEKVYIYQTELIGGRKVQRIKIVWNCIGEFVPPKSTKTA